VDLFAIEEKIMATITIKDLQESVELDREAMQAIIGGSRTGGAIHSFAAERRKSHANRIVDYPTGIKRSSLTTRNIVSK